MTLDRKHLRWLALMLSALLLGCGPKQVVVQGEFPVPLVEPLPLTLGVVYTEAFSSHEIFDENSGRSESDWLVKTGEAQTAFWDILLGGMFERVVPITDHDSFHSHLSAMDAVLIPYVEDLQYSVPLHTNVKVFEIWMRYRFRLVTPDAIHDHDGNGLSYNPTEHIADWQLSAYGKTPSKFLQSDEEAVNAAAVVALRDAGANFVTSFERITAINDWLKNREIPTRQNDTGAVGK